MITTPLPANQGETKMKKAVLMFTMLALGSHAQAAIKPCEELKDEIAKKIESKGVQSYTLKIVPAEESSEGREVGSCEQGSKKIYYIRAGNNTGADNGE
ncbi:MAG: hypothetical protein RL194_21 [Pseudomonadota bacterium]